MSLETRLAALVAAIGADIKAIQAAGGAPFFNEEKRTTTYSNATVNGTDVFTGFTPVANHTYEIDALLSCQSNSTGSGIQTAFVGPASGITRAAQKILAPNTASTDFIAHLSALNTYHPTALSAMTTPTLMIMKAIIEVGASPAAGNLKIGARAEIAAALAVQIFPGSFMRWRDIT